MASVNRRLTSILATDCVGFSSLMEKDEEKTLDNLKACRSIIDPVSYTHLTLPTIYSV